MDDERGCDELVLSDVHIHSYPRADNEHICYTNFTIHSEDHENDGEMVNADSDGDLLVRRKRKLHLRLAHYLATPLSNVGLQVWPGSLLLSNYLLHKPHVVCGKTVLDLGCGVGLTSILAAMCGADYVYATDVRENVLSLCKQNVEAADYQNISMLKYDLTWKFPATTSIESAEQSTNEIQPFGCNEKELSEMFDKCQIILAADLIYDIDLTAALFDTLFDAMSTPPSRTCFITLEKRLNWTWNTLSVGDVIYEHFMECIELLSKYNGDDDHGVRFEIENVDISLELHQNLSIIMDDDPTFQRSEHEQMYIIISTFPS